MSGTGSLTGGVDGLLLSASALKFFDHVLPITIKNVENLLITFQFTYI